MLFAKNYGKDVINNHLDYYLPKHIKTVDNFKKLLIDTKLKSNFNCKVLSISALLSKWKLKPLNLMNISNLLTPGGFLIAAVKDNFLNRFFFKPFFFTKFWYNVSKKKMPGWLSLSLFSKNFLKFLFFKKYSLFFKLYKNFYSILYNKSHFYYVSHILVPGLMNSNLNLNYTRNLNSKNYSYKLINKFTKTIVNLQKFKLNIKVKKINLHLFNKFLNGTLKLKVNSQKKKNN